MTPRGLGAPLEGVLVADLTRLLPGSLTTQILADLGARVVKVEAPGEGDYSRWIPPMVATDTGEHGYTFAAFNRGKESVVLDLKSDAGREAALRLAREADVLVEGFRPGVMERLGLGVDALQERNPALVVASLSGYGASGPLRDAPGHDVNYQALAGILQVTGEADGPPVVPAVQVADMTGGLVTALGIVAALREAEATGEGAHLDLALADAARLVFWPHVLRAVAEDGGPGRGELELAGGMACYGLYQAGDGRHVALGALEPKFWAAFCDAVDRPDLADRGHDPEDDEARRETAAVLQQRPAQAWVDALAPQGIPITPVLAPAEVPTHPQVKHRGTGAPWHPGEDAEGDVPRLGEHTAAVLRELGFDDDEVAAMVHAGGVGG